MGRIKWPARGLELLFRQRHDARAPMHRCFGQSGGLRQEMVGKEARGRYLGLIEPAATLLCAISAARAICHPPDTIPKS